MAQAGGAVAGPSGAGASGEPNKNGACNPGGQWVLLAVWADVGEHMRQHLDSFTLADMVSRSRGQGLQTPVAPEFAEAPEDLPIGQPVST